MLALTPTRQGCTLRIGALAVRTPSARSIAPKSPALHNNLSTGRFPASRAVNHRTRVLKDADIDAVAAPLPSTTTPSPAAAPAAAAAAGSLFGAISLITGSTVGAGMLALPEVTAPAGFAPTAAGLVMTWALLTAEAMLMAEVNLALLARSRPEDAGKIVTLRQMAQRTLGPGGKVVTLIYLLLSYCLLVAYLAKSSEVLGFFSGALAPSTAAGLLCASTAGLFLFGGTAAADRMNQALTSLLLGLFAFIIAAGLGEGDVPAALAAQPANWAALSPSIPIIFLTLVYHDLIPVICSYLGGDRGRVRTALVAGSLIPLGMFLSWEGVALATLPSDGVVPGAGVDPLALFLAGAPPATAAAVQVFSFVALITSFTATVVGLTETLRTEVPPLIRSIGAFVGSEELSTYDSGSGSGSEAIEAAALACEADPNADECALEPGQGFAADPGRVLALALTLGPPLAFTAENPGAFLAVLSVAGGYGMTALYGLMPPLMAWRLREADEARAAAAAMRAAPAAPAPQPRPRLMPGGVPALAGVLAGAAGVGLTRVAVDADGALAALAKAGSQVGAPAVMMDLIADLAAVASTPAF